ncbi:MAG: sulfite exporter TauE/SafE family protein [Verrucomicrobiota bacterium]
MPTLSQEQWIFAIIGAICVGLGKGGIPGIGNLTVAIYAQIFSPKESVGILLPVLIFADVVAIVIYRQHAEWKMIAKLFPISAAGVILATFLFNTIPADLFQVIIGSILLIMTGLHFLKKQLDLRRPTAIKNGLPYEKSKWFVICTGLLGGVATMLANAAGPIAAFYLMAMKLPKYAFISTSAWFFFLINVFKIPFQASLDNISFTSLQLSIALGLVAAVSAGIAPQIVKYIPQKQFSTLIWMLIIISGLKMVIHV